MRRTSLNQIKRHTFWGVRLPLAGGVCLLFVECESYFMTLTHLWGGSGGIQAERAGARTARLASGEHFIDCSGQYCQQPLPSLPVGFKEASHLLMSQKLLCGRRTQNFMWIRGEDRFALYQFGLECSSQCLLEDILAIRFRKERPWEGRVGNSREVCSCVCESVWVIVYVWMILCVIVCGCTNDCVWLYVRDWLCVRDIEWLYNWLYVWFWYDCV